MHLINVTMRILLSHVSMNARALIDYGDVILRLDLDVSHYDLNGLPDTPRIRAARAVVNAIRAWEAASADESMDQERCINCGKARGEHYAPVRRRRIPHYWCYATERGLCNERAWMRFATATDSLSGASVPAVDPSWSPPKNALTPPPIGTPPEDTTPHE